MKLAIADPPYLGNAELFYGERPRNSMNAGGKLAPLFKADIHPDAHIWDTPEAHEDLVLKLVAEYDGWAIAMLPRNLRYYMLWVPADTRVAVWHMPTVMPTGSHPRRRWEPVLVYVPKGRRKVWAVPNPVTDVHSAPFPHKRGAASFAGAKPRSWTRWVLDMLGYRENEDTVADLFGGSGAVANEIAQLTLNIGANNAE